MKRRPSPPEPAPLFGPSDTFTHVPASPVAVAEHAPSPPPEPAANDDSREKYSFSPRRQRPPLSHERFGHYVPTYNVTWNGCILLDSGYTAADLLELGAFRVTTYITRELRSVEAIGPVWDVPESILVRFDAATAVTHEAWRLTVNLWEKVSASFVEFERRYERGEPAQGTSGDKVDADTYRDMLARVEAVREKWDRTGAKVYVVSE